MEAVDKSNVTALLHNYETQLTKLKHEVAILTMQNKEYTNTIKVFACIIFSIFCTVTVWLGFVQ